MNTSLFSNTPSVTVLDNRGLQVRELAYYRHPDEPTTTQTRVTYHQYDTRGTLKQSADPRLHESGKANFHYLTDLAGNVLRARGVDNGTSVSLSDAAGRAFIAVSNISTAADGSEDKSQAVTRTWQYEEASLPGRPLSITEQVTGGAARITERFVYASNTEVEKDQNLAGQCISHYDTAGLAQTNSIALTGEPLSISRRLLNDVDNPDVVADWQEGDASVWNDQLSNESHTTLTMGDATGAVLTTTDTKGNVQRVAYDVSGLMSGSWLTLKGGVEQVIVKSLTYSAAGQKLREEHGNGVVTTYSYEPETHRLIGIRAERPTGHALGAKVLQDLRYEYDLVGNVVKIHNDAEETRFWRNQKVEPENTYTYDSLYQLVKTTGREMANAGQQNSHLPSAIIPFSSDSSVYTNYTRTYTYDETGNLTKVNHSAPATSNNYTTTMTVSDSSNRSVQSTLTDNTLDVDGFFTVGGQQKQLQPGQHLIWTPRNELLKVTPVVRDGDVDDVESYRYDAGSQRLLKVSKQKAANSVQTLRALYLPGVELRSVAQDNTETESLQVVTIGEAGRAQVRVLHWENGRPEDISNDQVRYSYDSLIGSCGLEVDSSGHVISMEEYYPYGGTAILTARSQVEVSYKTVRYSGKERDATGLYYYGYRYYQPWVGRWLSSAPAGTIDGLNLFRMVRNNPVTLRDVGGMYPESRANITSDKIRFESNPSHSRINREAKMDLKAKSNTSKQINDIHRGLSDYLWKMKISDRPYINSSRLMQYELDDNDQNIRKRRVETAKQLNVSTTDATSKKDFYLLLSDKVLNEYDKENFMFGKCAEMAAVAATTIANVATLHNKSLYIFQEPDMNHTLVLMSDRDYKSGDRIDWRYEHLHASITIDLWQASMDKKHTSLASLSSRHRYTKSIKTRAYIQTKMT